MALINLKDLLTHAQQNKYAVGAFNVTNLDLIDTLIDSAVEENSPIIMQIAEVHFKYLNFEEIGPAIINAANKVRIPICVHLDHGQSLQTVVRAIRAGFTSVMFDGSKYPLDENIARTKEVVNIAHSVGVSVEGEIGAIGGEAVGEQAATAHAAQRELFTKVEEAIRFREETNLDAMAIAIGNVHGLYKGEPELDFDRLTKIRNSVDVPLVLHGGSGISDDDFRKAVSLGICKINFYTEMSNNAVDAARTYLQQNPGAISYPDLVKKAMLAAKETVKDRLRVFGSAKQCAADKSFCISCDEESCEIVDPRFQPDSKAVLYSDLVDRISKEVISQLNK
ncbi:MAG: class II fructose-bisphosphate aldolase family protein [Actinomycetota bacterium]|jgi:fructose-bisphosphate aldolase class II|nr:class II fructose-bisphosphate aldolase family protein [Actinomycetota bacterium]